MKYSIDLTGAQPALADHLIRLLRPTVRSTGMFRSPGVLVAVVTFGWLLMAVVTSWFRLDFFDSGGIYTERWLVGVILLTVALSLVGYARAADQPRLRWLALGIVVYGIGSSFFQLLPDGLAGSAAVTTGLYGSLLTRWVMVVLTTTGIALAHPPRLTPRWGLALLAGFLLLIVAIAVFARTLPTLTVYDVLPPEPVTGFTPGFTATYWWLGGTLAAACLVAAVTSLWRTSNTIASWIVVAAVLQFASVAHAVFRPGLFGINSELTSSNILMTAVCVVVVLGCMFGMGTIADDISSERDALARETRRLADLQRLRVDFTTMVAHELAQPLLAIRRTAEVLEVDDGALDQRRAASSIVTEATILFTLIDDVRASAEVDSDDFSLGIVPTDVGQILEQARDFAGALTGQHAIGFERHVSGEVWADPGRIGQVMRNLLANAGRHTPATVAVTVRAVPVGPSTVRIEVEDDGPGIDADQLKRIFEKFGRGGSNEPGLGVGLYLSRRILRGFGSDLQYRRGEHGGACFWFDLPRVSGRPADYHPAR